MTGVLKDFSFTIAYLVDIIIFSRMADKHLSHIQQVFEKLSSAHLSMKLRKCHFFTKEIQYFRHILSTKGIRPLPSKIPAVNNMHQPKTAKQVHTFLGLTGYYKKFIKNVAKMAKPLPLLTCQKAKFEWTPIHHTAFLMLKESVTQAPILCYLDPTKWYIVYKDVPYDACAAQLSQEHDGMEFPIAFLSHFHGYTEKMEHHRTRSLQTTGNTSQWKNNNNKVNRWGLELATYNLPLNEYWQPKIKQMTASPDW